MKFGSESNGLPCPGPCPVPFETVLARTTVVILGSGGGFDLVFFKE